jgi:hypothetical protein
VVTRERMRSYVSRRATRWVALVVAASTVATGCGSKAEPQQGHGSPVPVIYAVKFPGGQEGHARIEYQLPDGTMKHENAPLPWESDLLHFRYGDQIVVSALPRTSTDLFPFSAWQFLSRRTRRERPSSQAGLESVEQRARRAIPSLSPLEHAKAKLLLGSTHEPTVLLVD